MRSDGVSTSMDMDMGLMGGVRRRFSIRFIRALKKIMSARKLQGNTKLRRRRMLRYYMIKKAAYLSMASAVGPRWAWARALKRRLIRHRAAHFMNISRMRMRKMIRTRRSRITRMRNMRRVCCCCSNDDEEEEEEDEWRSEDVVVLRRLVPGGSDEEEEEEGHMDDIGKLLGETAHYIRCLSTQVQVMRSIAHHLSTTYN